ncbi:MAG TPA: hypothetical protein VHW69_04320 [Rhizomicrobium sp.]|jgi:hypothetical protein|nr:hypothetical protein [Rhizomicrobium sp.]
MAASESGSSASDRLKAAIARVCSPDSHYWAFRRDEEIDFAKNYEIEVRLDIDPQTASAFVAPPNWRVAHTKPDVGMVFLRRHQPLTDDALKAMFAEVLSLAIDRNGRFHSWMHAPDLPDW